ncbi:MAG: aspartate-semialdehyde dehydrogenase [Deltaproteobacteria bacterium]|nr:aspartate-semialdehyde dehydrogenase [Deltaproteobacteria bacterium]
MTVGKKVAVVGATGVVGQEMLRVLHERSFPVREVIAVASERSAGKTVTFGDQELTIRALSADVFEGVDIALFSIGAEISLEWSPVAAAAGAVVIDNSSAFRMDDDVPLVVPECNMDAAANRPRGIIANPNCSTIQMVVALQPLHDEAKIERVVVATYQAVSGAGAPAVACLDAQRRSLALGEPIDEGVLEGQLAGNLLMHWSCDEASGYQEEELKMVHETRKILGDPTIRVSPTAVRVPVATGHSEAITLETARPLTPERARELLEAAPGVEVVDDFAAGVYPTPLDCEGRDPVFVGRIRADVGNPGGLQLWVVSDNLRKGAALNAVQIAEGLS